MMQRRSRAASLTPATTQLASPKAHHKATKDTKKKKGQFFHSFVPFVTLW
jgi:hypothetical protein